MNLVARSTYTCNNAINTLYPYPVPGTMSSFEILFGFGSAFKFCSSDGSLKRCPKVLSAHTYRCCSLFLQLVSDDSR